MPPLVPAGVPVGVVSSEEASPLLRGALLTLAGHDHQAAALGARAVGPGHELDSSGTAEALVRTVSRRPSHADAARLAIAGITTDPSIEPATGPCSAAPRAGWRRTARSTCLASGPDGLAQLDAAAEQAPVGRVVVGGLGRDALTLGGIAGGVGPGEVWKAVVAAAADEALALHRAMDDVVGPAVRVVVTGGWRHSAEVMRAKAARFDHLEVSSRRRGGRARRRDARRARRRCDRTRRTLGDPVTSGERTWFADERHAEVLRLLATDRPRRECLAGTAFRGQRGEHPQGPRPAGGARSAASGARRRDRQAAACGRRPNVATRTEQAEQKLAIARHALRFVPDGGTLLLDAGTTTLRLAELLPTDRDLVVYTNAVPVLSTLLQRGIAVVGLGGRLRPRNGGGGRTADPRGARRHQRRRGVPRHQRAVVSIAGSPRQTPTRPWSNTQMLAATRQRVFLVDTSKFGRESLARHATLDDIDVLVTDDAISAHDRERFREADVTVEVAR